MWMALVFAAGSGMATEPRGPAIPIGPEPSPSPPWHVPEGAPAKVLTLEANVLAAAMGRFSMNLEFLPASHHAIVISPHAYVSRISEAAAVDGYGGEFGYRYYSASDGPRGLFMGASLLRGDYSFRSTDSQLASGCVSAAASTPCEYTSWGGALDLGYQWVLGDFVLGTGVGASYTAFTETPRYPDRHRFEIDALFGAGLRPRVLFAVGPAF